MMTLQNYRNNAGLTLFFYDLEPPLKLPSLPPYTASRAKQAQYYREQELKVAEVALDEAFHQVAKGFGDEELFRAYAKWKGVPVPEPPVNHAAAPEKYAWFWSTRWHPRMHEYCNYKSVPVPLK